LFAVGVVYGCETWSVTLREKRRQMGRTFVTPKMQYAYYLVQRSYMFRRYYHSIFRELTPEFL